jgi:prepilin-type processing-associated H-X9-DG protein
MNRDRQRRDQRAKARGVTRVDVVIAAAAISVLGVNLVTALPGLRESARRQQCASNLAHLGRAIQTYHEVCHCLPPAAFWESSELKFGEPLSKTDFGPDSIRAIRANWAQLLLLHLGDARLSRRFRQDRSIAHPSNEAGRVWDYDKMRCPSDSFHRPTNHFVVTFSDGTQSAFARGNYAINGGSQNRRVDPGSRAEPAPKGGHFEYDQQQQLFQWWGNGIAGFNKCFALDDISNGLSATVAVDEVRAGIAEIDPRGAWALGRIGSSVTWAHGVNGDEGRPNNQSPDADDILRGSDAAQLVSREVARNEGMPFCDHCNNGPQATARSKHPGGVNTLMLDGAVRFVSDAVDNGVWHSMHSRETPKQILASESASIGKSPVSEIRTGRASETEHR